MTSNSNPATEAASSADASAITKGGPSVSQGAAVSRQQPGAVVPASGTGGAWPDDIVDRIAAEIGLHVAHHIETMYPEAAEAVAWGSAKMSIQGCIRNAVASAGRAAEQGCADEWINRNRALRRAAMKRAAMRDGDGA